jgi:predicted RNA-binding Zn-ribbon protein involved in translation (DUF1610 family)
VKGRQKRDAYSLIRAECCNLSPDGYCVPLDCPCPQLQSEGLLCKWFENAVLPLDKVLHAEITGSTNNKTCSVCGKLFVPMSNRAKYCPECGPKMRRRKDAERKYLSRHGN